MADVYKKISEYNELAELDASGKMLVAQSDETYSVGADTMADFVKGRITMDNTPTQGSSNPVTSNGVYNGIRNYKISDRRTDQGMVFDDWIMLQHRGGDEYKVRARDALGMAGFGDSVPTQNSVKVVMSGGVYDAIEGAKSSLTNAIQAVQSEVDALEEATTPDETLTVQGAAADAKKTGDELANLNSVINVFDSQFNNVNYCGEPSYYNPSNDANGRLHIKQDRNILKIYNNNPTTEVTRYYRLNNGVAFLTASTMHSDERTIKLLQDHKYRLRVQKLAGIVSGVSHFYCGLSASGTERLSNTEIDLIDLEEEYRDFVGNGELVNLYLWSSIAGIVASNLIIGITLQDLTNTNDYGDVNINDIEKYSENGVYTNSFTFSIPFNGDYSNKVFTCLAKYVQSNGVTDTPKICFRSGTQTGAKTSEYELGGDGVWETKQWRFIRPPMESRDCTVYVTIPQNVTVYIKQFYSKSSETINRVKNGIRINGHRRVSTTPYDTLPGLEMGARAGYAGFIEIPKRLSDGVWIFYHDDSLHYDDTYIRQADGSELPSNYNGTLWSSIDFDTASSWDWGISVNSSFAGTKPMRMEEYFEVCTKTGVDPIFSFHPFPTISELNEIKTMAKKYGVLSSLGVKSTGYNIGTLYSVFGNEIASYTVNVSSNATATTVNAAINALTTLAECTVKRIVELLAKDAYNAYFGESTYTPFEDILSAGLICSIAQQYGAHSPTDSTHITSDILPQDMIWWAEHHGVTEFTDEYNYSIGLNW